MFSLFTHQPLKIILLSLRQGEDNYNYLKKLKKMNKNCLNKPQQLVHKSKSKYVSEFYRMSNRFYIFSQEHNNCVCSFVHSHLSCIKYIY